MKRDWIHHCRTRVHPSTHINPAKYYGSCIATVSKVTHYYQLNYVHMCVNDFNYSLYKCELAAVLVTNYAGLPDKRYLLTNVKAAMRIIFPLKRPVYLCSQTHLKYHVSISDFFFFKPETYNYTCFIGLCTNP